MDRGWMDIDTNSENYEEKRLQPDLNLLTVSF